MNSYRRKAAILIALVSTVLAIVASTAAWFVARENGALMAAVIAALAAITCGLGIYPIVVRLNHEQDRQSRDLLSSHIALLEAMGKAVAKRDSDTGDHNYRVTDIALAIGERMGVGKEAMRGLLSGSLLHDVGKIGVPDRILLKPGRLDDQEMALMRSHVPQGEDIVDGIPSLDEARDVIACHHEKWDGSGYPRGLAGEAIPLGARIFAVADVFDTLCSPRPYKEAMSFETAWGIIRDDAGSHFDPEVVDAFRPIARRLYELHFRGDRRRSRELLERQIRKYFF